jgi:hypothetical protein
MIMLRNNIFFLFLSIIIAYFQRQQQTNQNPPSFRKRIFCLRNEIEISPLTRILLSVFPFYYFATYFLIVFSSRNITICSIKFLSSFFLSFFPVAYVQMSVRSFWPEWVSQWMELKFLRWVESSAVTRNNPYDQFSLAEGKTYFKKVCSSIQII